MKPLDHSDASALLREQVDPTPNEYPSMWGQIIEEMQARDLKGRLQYGTPLQPFNGRNVLRDIKEEILDFLVYLQQYRFEISQLGEDLRKLEDDTLPGLAEPLSNIHQRVAEMRRKYSNFFVK